jgi:hypothetical protein
VSLGKAWAAACDGHSSAPYLLPLFNGLSNLLWALAIVGPTGGWEVVL